MDITDLPAHIFDEMKHFFEVYKHLENKSTAVNEVSGKETALKIIQEAICASNGVPADDMTAVCVKVFENLL